MALPVEIGRHPKKAFDHLAAACALSSGSQHPGTRDRPRSHSKHRSITRCSGNVVRPARYAFWWHHREFLDSCDGGLSLHYCPNYPSVARADHPIARAAYEGKSDRRPQVDGEMDHHPDRPHGFAVGYRPDPDVQLSGGANRADHLEFQLWAIRWEFAPDRHVDHFDGSRYDVGYLARPVDL